MRESLKERRLIGLAAGFLIAAFSLPVLAAIPKPPLYGERYCGDPDFHCITIGSPDAAREAGAESARRSGRESWEGLWPDERERVIVMKVNRMNVRLKKGMVIAVPNHMEGKTYMDFAPFPSKLPFECEPVGEPVCRLVCENCEDGDASYKRICESQCKPKGDWTCGPDGAPVGEKLIIIDLAQLAFAAYAEDGTLLRWGPVSGGRNWGAYVIKDNLTVVGEFEISRKYGRGAKSRLYPRATKDKPAGGAPVPYFMRFHPGYGLHHYHTVPGRHASHGCVRLFFDDAKWLNQEFAEIGTRVTVRPYEAN